ncbi:hypothetical protein [Lacipirellula sp.]|uniref:hypothetical protein n=1 Tax=Lacipirellula sp. TaxID=2691419 RepID=UPI003D0D3512
MLGTLLNLLSVIRRIRFAPQPAPLPRSSEVRMTITDARVAGLLQAGDLLLFRGVVFSWRDPRTYTSKLICIASRGIHSHAAKLAFWGGLPFVAEVREMVGGRIVTLDSQVRRYPGRIDVYQANWRNCHAEFNRVGVVRYMLELAGCSYGWRSLLAAAPLHLPFIRWRVTPNVDDASRPVGMPFCSQACAMADRIGGGVDVVPNLADEITEPGDMARSDFYRYAFTLIPEAVA